MKKQSVILVSIIIAILGSGIAIWVMSRRCDAESGTCQAVSTPAKTVGANTSEINQISQDMRNGALLVDVREPDEYAAGHAEGATNIPLGIIQGGKYPSPDKDAKMYLYCRSGKRAATAVAVLKDAGYQNASSIGGLTDWQNMGGKVTQR